jgi:hypothetical protein
MKFKFCLAFTLTVGIFAGAWLTVSPATENPGIENIDLEGGRRGKVPFPHHRHQKDLGGDCLICHSVFPQETGAIEMLKAQGTLKKKFVMNKLCTKCHKEKKKAGEPSGPTTCSKCHIRDKK